MGTTANLLELMAFLLQETDSAEPGDFKIIPVLVNDLSSYEEVITSIVRRQGGITIKASELAEGVEGTLRDDLKLSVLQVLNVSVGGGERIELDLVQDGSYARAQLRGVRISESTSPGDRMLGGIALSLFDHRLEEVSFAVVMYSETTLDDIRAGAVWRLFTEVVSRRRLMQLRTLVVLIDGSRVRYERHCSHGTSGVSLRGRLNSDSFEIRKDWATDKDHIGRLVERGKMLVLFLGAGFSSSSSLPLGNTLRDQALLGLIKDVFSIDEAAKKFFESLRTDQRLLPKERTISSAQFVKSLTLERVLREEIHFYGAEESPTLLSLREENDRALESPGRSVLSLRRIIESGKKIVVVTVNFDTLVETGLDDHVRVFASEADFETCSEFLEEYARVGGKVPVLKLHGTISDFSTIVATVDEMSRGLHDGKLKALQTLETINGPTSSRWIYIGYSMRDPDITPALCHRGFSEGVTEEAWVSPFVVPTSQAFAHENRSYGTRPNFWSRSITQSADVFMEELESTWRLE